MSLKKLSIAAVISIGIISAGACTQVFADDGISQNQLVPDVKPSAYGAGPAGTFRMTGTLPPGETNAAGVTETKSFLGQPTGAAAGMAAQGIYGQCVPCPTGQAAPATVIPAVPAIPVVPATPGATVVPAVPATPAGPAQVVPVVPVAPTQPLGGASGIDDHTQHGTMGTPATPAQPSGGAAGIEDPTQMDTEEETPVQPTAPGATGEESPIPINPNVTGGAAGTVPVVPVSPVAPVVPGMAAPGMVVPGMAAPATVCPQTCVPGADAGEGSGVAPENFRQPENPGVIAPPVTSNQADQMPTGGAAGVAPMMPCPATPVCPMTPAAPVVPVAPTSVLPATPVAPVTPVVPVAPVTQVPMMQQPTVIQQPVAIQPSQAMVAPGAATTVIPLTTPTVGLPAATMTGGAAPLTPFTGGAAPLTGCPASLSCTVNPNADYLERQVYAYPSFTGRNNVITPAGDNAIVMGGKYGNVAVLNAPTIPNAPQQNLASIPGLEGITGAAAPLTGCPTGGMAGLRTGAAITRPIFRAESGQQITLQTPSSMQISRLVLVPMAQPITGAAAPIAPTASQFTDVPQNFWASNDINRLASSGIIAGYPDRTFKPDLPVTRAEFSSMLVSGLNLQSTPTFPQQVFNDVPTNHWANKDVDRVLSKGLVTGYPNDTFRPNDPISRAEALSVISRVLPGTTNMQEAMNILDQYQDGNQVPTWARMSVAEAMKADVLQGQPNANMINANKSATRADVASMISNVRQTLALDPMGAGQTTGAAAGMTGAITGGAATIQQQIVTIPTLNIKMNDRISARTSHVGDTFKAQTQEPINVNGITFPAGSTVNGRVVEVVRPGNGSEGALKVAFTNVTNNGQTANLPREVLTAQVQKGKEQGVLSRLVEFPFVWPGRIIGVAGRTVGGVTTIIGNTGEQFLSGLGSSAGELVSGEFGSAGRSALGSVTALGKGTLDSARTALSGGTGLLAVSSDEIGYLAGGDGSQIAIVNPDEQLSVAFGCEF